MPQHRNFTLTVIGYNLVKALFFIAKVSPVATQSHNLIKKKKTLALLYNISHTNTLYF